MAEAKKHPHAKSTSESAAKRETDDYEAASHSTADYAEFMPQLRPKKKWPRVLGWIILGIIILAALGAGGYWLANRKSSPQGNTQNSHANSSSQAGKIAAATKSYTSTNLNLSFNYPENWSVSDPGDGKLTATSPAMQLTDANGQNQTGQVIMAIQNEDSANFSAFKQGNAVAVLTSQKITYARPTSDQRADTYISFLQYAATTTDGALDGLYITGNAGYQKGQAIPEIDITKVDPVVTVTFAKCDSASCSSTAPLSINATMWNTSNFSVPIVAMLKSLAIQ